MKRVLYSWIGFTDYECLLRLKDGQGPLLQGVLHLKPDQCVVLANSLGPDSRITEDQQKQAFSRLVEASQCSVDFVQVDLEDPTDYETLYEKVSLILEESSSKLRSQERFFHLSPGTPAMSSIWLLLSKSKYPAKLISTTRERGFKEVRLPFEFSMEAIPHVLRANDELITRLFENNRFVMEAFDEIQYRSSSMNKAVVFAKKLSTRDVPVLILGESGTGKEMFARAIHKSSPRYEGAFVPVNCGAIPRDLIESQLFGHKKGSFTGATSDQKGFVEEASGGVLFLDEIGEMPLDAQVRLLRVLQEKQVQRVGETRPRKVDFRVIAATHVDLQTAVLEGKFREDLYHRLAVGILRLPPLRQRIEDAEILIDHFLKQVDFELNGETGAEPLTLSGKARQLLLSQPFYGNARELRNLILRSALWSSSSNIGEEEVREALEPSLRIQNEFPDLDLSQSVDLRAKVSQYAARQIKRALELTRNKKIEAADLLGFDNYQTMDSWLKKGK